ncbi:esterase [Caenispirillum salinarum AK4]|uniref:Esterase n=1 Tax=Caenispirillum salinarum AK4 TaxID=1238182 RepID=K9H6R8_9PROT|nr:hydrolase 2, exosortase A system-associated [Caenispirillum salinarum]EKV32744.1 esterase [Caenispirillum salinarum AK4]
MPFSPPVAATIETAPRPLFLDGPSGRLFAVLYAGRAARRALVYLPPFAEEMNRSRRMAALLGRRLAAAGEALLVVDPRGTGDSDGAFHDARWDHWRADAAAAAAWLRAQGLTPLGAVGLRSGALLALDLARAEGLDHALLWHPVTKGEMFLSQLLRVRVAAGLEAGARETVKDLRARLAASETLDVAGYPVTPGMAADLDGLMLKDMAEGYRGRLTWLQVAADPAAPVPPAVGAVVEGWMRRRVDAEIRQVAGEPFWSIEETTLAPALLEETVEVVTVPRHAPPPPAPPVHLDGTMRGTTP